MTNFFRPGPPAALHDLDAFVAFPSEPSLQGFLTAAVDATFNPDADVCHASLAVVDPNSPTGPPFPAVGVARIHSDRIRAEVTGSRPDPM
jgi:hypothetical protein